MKKISVKKMNTTYSGLRCLIAIIVVINTVSKGPSTCEGAEVYFPLSSLRLEIPMNEKSQSIFSKMPIGRFQVLSIHNNSVATNYNYRLEKNPNTEFFRVNQTTGELFFKDGPYRPLNATAQITITAKPKNGTANTKIAHMSVELIPMTDMEYCKNLENICFWKEAHYTIVEHNDNEVFLPIRVGSFNPRGTKYICSNVDISYRLNMESKYLAIKDNILYTKLAVDHESLNSSAETNSLTAMVSCLIHVNQNQTLEFQKTLKINVIDRNDNGPVLQDKKVYSFLLQDPHFRTNETIGEKIIFTDSDAVETNVHIAYTIHNDTYDLVRPICNAYETDHTGKRNSIISCQLIFARNGILSVSPYCVVLEANDRTIDVNITHTAKAFICISVDLTLIHEMDRPRALALRGGRQHRKSPRIVNSEESLLADDSFGGHALAHNVIVNYPKDVYVYRTAMTYSRIAQPEHFLEYMRLPGLRFNIAEDRSGAFGITPIAGIVYVKSAAALQNAIETVYFFNITWNDNHARSYVINVHLVDGRPTNTTCDHKIRSRSQTCAQIRYQKDCVEYCGLASNGGGCEWRGSNAGFFGLNYASCVPDAKYCPDNVCDPLEELSLFICPQDCVVAKNIFGPHSVNSNKRGILSASGTCTCEDHGKCSCAPIDDDDEPKPRRKAKKEKSDAVANLDQVKSMEQHLENQEASNQIVDQDEQQQVYVAGIVCGTSCMIIAITCPLAFIVLIACLLVSRRNLKRKTMGKGQTMTAQKASDITDDDCDIRNGDLPLMPLENEFKFNAGDAKWEFDRDRLVLDTVLGEGEFGKVVRGYATEIAGLTGVTTVAVKMLKNGANSVEYMALLSEFQLLQEVSHPNVIKLLGACTKTDTPMVIIEYACYGSLRSYLRLSRKIECAGIDFTDGVEAVTVKDILSFAWQICRGMAYLTEIKLVHRDLAARNVLLADGKICKVSDFGLTRDVYEDDAYLKRSRDRVPVKWMAPESLADHVYTTKSDVWSFGVLCWELITLGASPYPGIPPQNLYHLLKTGYRMERPENCSEDIYSVVRTCWADDPNARPSFKYLASQFEKLLGNNAKYIELESHAISNPLYCNDETKLLADSNATALQTDLKSITVTTQLTSELGEPECLDHLWCSPKMGYDTNDCLNSRDLSLNLSPEFLPPPGYDIPRPFIETSNTEQKLRYANDLRFPPNTRKSVCAATIGKTGMEHYSVPVKRGHSYMDMTNRTLIPDNLDGKDFDKHISKNISFRFSSLLNLTEQEDNTI